MDGIMKARERYRSSEKGKMTAREYAHHYYHTVSKFNPEEMQKRRAYNRLSHYRKYGLTPEQAEELKQKGCGICGAKDEMRGILNIDHDHKTGKIRGVLCTHCNVLLGWFEKSRAMLPAIKAYLKRSE